ncbi:thymidylate synthase [Malassezia furfur]|uniref:thymidylate synthase n=1 Tax=Malassezia furfur TaxID=55194 RepID=A0ABY8EJL8_MALFU|nr:TMP1 [Malassezia furfur]WFD45892.1 thymidylate synthase [Malassezia furfur]
MPRLILVRHGITEWSKDGKHTGRTDIPLLTEGLVEAEAFGKQLVGRGPEAVIDLDAMHRLVRSPRLRCKQTTDAVFGSEEERKQKHLPDVLVDDDLREWDYGAYEGVKTKDIQKTRPGWDVFRDGCPDSETDPNQPGELPEQVGARADRVLARVRKFHEENHNVVLVTHGHFSRVLIARYLRQPVQSGALFDMETTGVAILDYAHHSLDEPVLKAMFSPKLYPHTPSTGHEELQYLNLVANVIRNGNVRQDRTGTGTRALFAPRSTLKFSLRNNTLPLLTTKRVFFRGVLEELLWFISGNTDANWLAERNVHIWDGNGSAEFLASRGLGHRRPGDLGPVYGFQWRHFGAKYVDADTDYTGQGVDQLAQVIHQIKTNPTDRRILLSAWNPPDMPLMALPPCHILCQFFVTPPTLEEAAAGRKPQLSCQMYQRSCDLGLGVPFNIASYALLTHLIAHVTGCEAAEFTLAMGDAHVYLDHIEPLQQQLMREPRAFPTIQIKRDVSNIDDFRADDFEVIGYQPHGKIDMRMSV